MARNFEANSTQYLEIDTAVATSYPFSCTAYVKIESVHAGGIITLNDKDTADQQMAIDTSVSGSNVRFRIRARNGSPTLTAESANRNLDTWYRVTGVWRSATDRELYVDGDSVAGGSGQTSHNFPSVDRTNIGYFGDSTPGSPFDGLIADACIWNAALTDTEIQQLNLLPANIIRQNSIQGYWTLLEDVDPEPDKSGNGNNLDVKNGPIPKASHPPILVDIVTEDDIFRIKDDADNSKRLEFDLGGATADKTATIVSSHTDDRTITLPNATDTLVGRDTTDILTGKTIDANNNTLLNLPTFSGNLTDLAIDDDKDWADKQITSLGGVVMTHDHKITPLANQLKISADDSANDEILLAFDNGTTTTELLKLNNTEIKASKNLNMNSNSINNANCIDWDTGGTLVNNANMIIADAGGLRYNVPDGDAHQFYFDGNHILNIKDDQIEFSSGRAHRISVTGTSIQIVAENTGDSVEIWNGTSRSNPTIDINDTTTTWKTGDSDVQAVLIQLLQNHDTPADDRTLANIDFMAENSASSDEIYARISASSNDISSGSEDGLLQLGVVSDGTLVSGIDIEGGTSGSTGAKLGFYGATPVARPTNVSNNTTAIITALENLGLFG